MKTNEWTIIKGIIKDRKLLYNLAKNDFKARFANSFLGVLWAYIQPLVTILIFWFVFQVGLKNGDVEGFPFTVWYAPAFLVWTFFSDTLNNMTNSLREYSYLVKKVNFNIGLIPAVKLLSGIFVHVVFIGFIMILNTCYGVPLSLFCLQAFYYFLCAIVLLLAQGILFSAIFPFMGDIGNIVGVILQVGFWATPIVWNSSSLKNEGIRTLLSLNPMYYICNGYRDSFLYKIGFWEAPGLMIQFWAITLALLWLGLRLFSKLSSDFVDVM